MNFKVLSVLLLVVAVAYIAYAEDASADTANAGNPNCPVRRTMNFVSSLMDRMRSQAGMSSGEWPMS